MDEKLEKKYWYISRHKEHCATCKYYKPRNEITGYDAWYQEIITTAWYTGKCWFNPTSIDVEAWKHKCGQYEEISEKEFVNSYGD